MEHELTMLRSGRKECMVEGAAYAKHSVVTNSKYFTNEKKSSCSWSVFTKGQVGCDEKLVSQSEKPTFIHGATEEPSGLLSVFLWLAQSDLY
jgi:hypothetical protein